jgi:hypothetical protein
LAFIFNLSDVCPRCGEEMTEFNSEEDQRRHLMECVDEKKHKMYEREKEKVSIEKKRKNDKLEKQEAVEREATWSFLGGKSDHLW